MLKLQEIIVGTLGAARWCTDLVIVNQISFYYLFQKKILNIIDIVEEILDIKLDNFHVAYIDNILSFLYYKLIYVLVLNYTLLVIYVDAILCIFLFAFSFSIEIPNTCDVCFQYYDNKQFSTQLVSTRTNFSDKICCLINLGFSVSFFF